jgi:hypothetical protein
MGAKLEKPSATKVVIRNLPYSAYTVPRVYNDYDR